MVYSYQVITCGPYIKTTRLSGHNTPNVASFVFAGWGICQNNIPILEPEWALGCFCELLDDNPALVDFPPEPGATTNSLDVQAVPMRQVRIATIWNFPYAQSVIVVVLGQLQHLPVELSPAARGAFHVAKDAEQPSLNIPAGRTSPGTVAIAFSGGFPLQDMGDT